ncbi:ADP-ribosylglycohydrolase family protein [Bacillus sp. FJAT-49711]|nr:ADP-ribosylglycohydrolase family protein [Bacillus sp. FJAT-49711]
MIPDDYIEKVYAGWLGKVIGVRHGANIEGWTYEQIERAFGDITNYPHDFKNFAADDDTNGPVYFLRALEDYTHTREITAEQIGNTWLNYAPDGHGFYWWGGYGVSSEHTAYMNLKNGIPAPQSGSIEQNGATIAEQIGGQIFIDVWGLIAPNQPELAAEYAAKAASVSHDRNGIYGGQFIAACVAKAFSEKDIGKIIETGLSVIPGDSEYTRMARAIINYYEKNPENWRDCFKYVKANFGYDRYPGVCHIIPNSAVIVLSLLYGEGDFSKSINICNMCGWDTDCNVANVGTIMGVRNGLEGISPHWREPINDFLCCSGVIGTLNILNIPEYALYTANLGYKIAEEKPNQLWSKIIAGKTPTFHFQLPGSTHAFRTDAVANTKGSLMKTVNTEETAKTGTRSLKLTIDRVRAGNPYHLYHQTYYRPDDFNDSRYDPEFSPILYPGQTVTATVSQSKENHVGARARLYVKDGNHNQLHYGEWYDLPGDEWIDLSFNTPYMEGACLEAAGIEFITLESLYSPAVFYLDCMDLTGTPHYKLLFEKERLEKWTFLRESVSQFTHLRGLWTLEKGELSGSYSGEPAECYTGDLKWKDYSLEASVIPKLGDDHRVLFRVQGGIRSYAVGLTSNNTITLFKNNNGYEVLATADYYWENDKEYIFNIKIVENKISVSINENHLISFEDTQSPYLTGQIGFGNSNGSHTHFKCFTVQGII